MEKSYSNIAWIALAVLAAATVSANAVSANAGIITSDSFDRANNTSLGNTNLALGGSAVSGYTEVSGNTGATENNADILSNRLNIFGLTGDASNPGFVVLNEPISGNVGVSSTVRFGFNNPTVGGTLKNMLMYQVLRPSITGSGYSIPVKNLDGAVGVWFGPNGFLYVRQWDAAGNQTALYNDNLFITGTQAGDAVIHGAGTLPTTLNGLGFDVDGDGTLESTEPFTLGVDVSGTSLAVSLNGQTMETISITAAAGDRYLVLAKNRWSGGNSIAIPTISFDDLVVVPEPTTLALLGIALVTLTAFARRKR